jgi:hypothetical protein
MTSGNVDCLLRAPIASFLTEQSESSSRDAMASRMLSGNVNCLPGLLKEVDYGGQHGLSCYCLGQRVVGTAMDYIHG